MDTKKLEKMFVNPKAVERKVKEMVILMKETRPEMTMNDMDMVTKAAIRYAKEVLKGKAAVLYGMSLDWAIDALKDSKNDIRIKKDIALKVLGHCMPQEITMTGVEGEAVQPILFQMARPKEVIEVKEVKKEDNKEVINKKDDGTTETNLYSAPKTK